MGLRSGAGPAIAVAMLAAPAFAECAAGAPTGVFQGAAGDRPDDHVEILLNLVCDAAGYHAQIFSSQSDFRISSAVGGAGRVELKFDTGSALGEASMTLDGDALVGPVPVLGGSRKLALTRTGPSMPLDATAPTLSLTTAQWRADLQAFAAELPKRHANAFFALPRERFEAEIADLDRRLPGLNGDQIFVGLQRIANLIGDGHTGLVLPTDRRILPVEIGRFGEDFRIVAVGPGLERALGARIVRIGGKPIAEAWRRALTLAPQGELPELQTGRALNDLRRGLSLHGLGITPRREHAVFSLRDDAGRAFDLDLPGLAPGAPLPPMTTAAARTGLARQNPDRTFWCQALAERQTVYCAFHAYQDLKARAAEMFTLIDQVHPAKLVIDMRDNGGGDNTQGYRWLILPLMQRADLNQKGRLYVLVGALTFSAAMNNAAQFQDLTKATLVGQRIGETPNSYQEPRQFRLPNSHLVVRASSLFYKFRQKGPNEVAPDVAIAPAWEDVKAGRDKALDWVLAQPAP